MSLRHEKGKSQPLHFSLLRQNIEKIWHWFLLFGESPRELHCSSRYNMRAEWNYSLTYLYCQWMWWFIGLESRESGMSNVQWSIRIQNQISAPAKRDGHFGLFAVPLSFQSKKNTLRRVWLHTCFTYANASIISWILHSNASPRPYYTSKTGNAYKQEQRPLLRKTDVTVNREGRNYLRRKNLYGN